MYKKYFSFQFPEWEVGVQIKLPRSHTMRRIQFSNGKLNMLGFRMDCDRQVITNKHYTGQIRKESIMAIYYAVLIFHNY